MADSTDYGYGDNNDYGYGDSGGSGGADYGYGDSNDYGYGDSGAGGGDTDYGYGDSNDYGYGDDAGDMGYGDQGGQDYGYGDQPEPSAPSAAPAPSADGKKRPKRRCSVTKFSLEAEAAGKPLDYSGNGASEGAPTAPKVSA
mmetsp:Transcript_1659/g.3546  ORF Transcript_1659/g.3546 Transcript_1659/m.3546 type:complete len:142 (-) Transcript_1659:162-587(-)